MTYVVSDIHGEYRKFLDLLKQIRFSEDDLMYVVGDLVDYGEEPMELLADLSVRLNIYPVAGEHDYLAARMLTGFEKMRKSGAAPDAGYISEMTAWVKEKGGQPTLSGFRELDEEQREGILDYLTEMPLFEEAEAGGREYLLVHKGIAGDPAEHPLEEDTPEHFFSAANTPDPNTVPLDGKILIVGHKASQSDRIGYGKGSIFLDCGAGQGGKLGCLCLENGREYYV